MGDTTGDLRSVVLTMKALAASNIGQYERSVRALADCNKESGEYRCHTHQYRCQIGVSTNLLIIAQTANSFSEDREKCFAAGRSAISPNGLILKRWRTWCCSR